METITNVVETPNTPEATQGMEIIEATLLNNVSGASPSNIKCYRPNSDV